MTRKAAAGTRPAPGRPADPNRPVRRGRTLVDRVAGLSGLARLGLALGAGLLAALGLAPLYLVPVLWVALPVLVLLIDAAPDRRQAALTGWAFGTGYFLGGLWWIGDAFFVEGGWLLAVMPFAVLGLAAGLGLFFALATTLARCLWSPGPVRILALVVGIGVAEALRGRVLTGFPWNGFGQMLAGTPLLMQPAALIGAEGLGLAVVFIGALPAVFLGRNRRGATALALVAAGLAAGGLGFGAWRLSGPRPEPVPGLMLRLVQPSIPQEKKWQIASRDAIFDTLLALSRGPVAGAGPDTRVLVIWPESSVPFLLQDAPIAREVIVMAMPTGATLVAGAVRRGTEPGTEENFFNAILVMDPAGDLTDAYDKLHLVPFGEYVPFEGALRWLGVDPLALLPGGFTAGTGARQLVIPGAPAVLPLICYEAIFPGYGADAQGAGWILNVTNDAWFGQTPGPVQHFAQARLRAVEEGLPLVRVGNNGVTAVVDGLGRIDASLPMGVVARLDAALPEATSAPLFTRLGALPAGVMVVACALLAWNARRKSCPYTVCSPD